MNPARIFALQGMRVPVNDGSPKGNGGGMTPSEAAHYCQGMPEHWYKSAMLRWGGDWSGANKLEYRLWDAAVTLKIRERWRIEERYNGQEMLRKLAGLAIYEMADPARFRHADAWKIRAAWMGLDKSPWFKVWRSRYEAVYNVMNEWTNDAWRHVEKQFAGEVLTSTTESGNIYQTRTNTL